MAETKVAEALPLVGMQVIETAGERGGLCGRLLADLGADVVLIEPPEADAARRAPPFAPDSELSLSFAHRNAGKRSVCLDLSMEAGRGQFLQLLGGADVWVESDRPGCFAELGLAPDVVLREHPRLIVASISDFGQTGPNRDLLGTDMIGYAMGGMLYRSGAGHRAPVVVPGSLAYDTAGVSAAFAIVAACLQRESSGRGQWLDVSVQEAVANLADWSVPIYSSLKVYQRRAGAGNYPIYRCKDGWVRMALMGKREWHAVLDWVGRPEELLDPALEDYGQRMANQAMIDAVLQRHFAELTKEDAAREAQRRGLAATPLLFPAEVLDNEHTRARESFVELEIGDGRCAKLPSGFLHLDRGRVGPRRGAPRPGEHGEEVLREMQEGQGAGGSLGEASTAAAPTPGRGAALLPFAGLRVIDFGTGVAGPEVARLLGEWGAEVIKVESSTAPDFIRTVVPGLMNAPFASTNRGKRSFGVDLKTEEGRRLALELVARADVVVENSASGVIERLGLGYEALRAVNPGIIMLSTQLLGSTGPWKQWSGYGPNAHAVGGIQYLWNYADEADQPAGSQNIHPDHYVGRLGALGIAAALLRRKREGRGALVEIAQFEVLVQLIGDLLAKESLAPGSVRPQGNESERGAPWGVYPCTGDDAWCVVNVCSDEQWRALCEGMDRREWAGDERFSSADGRRRAGAEIDEAIATWTGAREPAEVMQALQSRGVPAGVVQNPAQQVEDPHLKERHFFQSLDQLALGPILVEGPFCRSEALPAAPAVSAPLLGQHTREVCRSLLGLERSEIDGLFGKGVLEETLPPEP